MFTNSIKYIADKHTCGDSGKEKKTTETKKVMLSKFRRDLPEIRRV